MIFNFTQHAATAVQVEEGVIDLSGDELTDLRNLLTFKEMPDRAEIQERAHQLAELADQLAKRLGYPEGVMIGGAPYLMPYLTFMLNEYGFNVYFAYSERVSKEVTSEDGTVSKVAEFKHLGFVSL